MYHLLQTLSVRKYVMQPFCSIFQHIMMSVYGKVSSINFPGSIKYRLILPFMAHDVEFNEFVCVVIYGQFEH